MILSSRGYNCASLLPLPQLKVWSKPVTTEQQEDFLRAVAFSVWERRQRLGIPGDAKQDWHIARQLVCGSKSGWLLNSRVSHYGLMS